MRRKDVGAFLDGIRGRFPTLEDVLVSDGKLIKIGLDSSEALPEINSSFREFMAEHGSSVEYITAAGTPWLTHKQKENDPELSKAYAQAMRAGRNDHVAVMGWKPYLGLFKAGHAWINFGALQDTGKGLQFDGDDSYSLYPLQVSAVLDRMHTRIRAGTFDNIVAHHGKGLLTGAKVHDDPTYPSVLLSGASGALIAHMVAAHLTREGDDRKHMARRIAMTLFGTAAGGGMGSVAGFLAAVSKNTDGVVVKQPEHGSGMLAILVTSAQCDILQTALEELCNTISGKYNVRNRNCAEFADEMLQDIGIEVKQVIGEYLDEEQHIDGRFDRTIGSVLSRRPDTRRGAFHRLKEEIGEVPTADGKKLSVVTLNVNGHAAILVEPPVTPDTPNHQVPLFDNPDLATTLNEALKSMRLMPMGDNNFALTFKDQIRTTPLEPAAIPERS